MKENRAIRIWQWSVILLVLCNIALMLFIWIRPGQQGDHAGGRGPRDFVIRELRFTDEQAKKYEDLIQDHQRSMKSLNKQAMDARQALFSNLKNGEGANATADSLAQVVAGIQKQIELATYRHFAQVRTICTETQKPEFDKIIGEVIKKMNRAGRGGPPPPGDRQGPPPGRDGEDRQPREDGSGPPPGDRPEPPPPQDAPPHP